MWGTERDYQGDAMTAEDKLNILIVDDNRDNHVAVGAALAELGENVVCVDSGTRALRRMLDEDFALVLLDVHMPGMDGFEVARLMRQIERLRRTPIIFLSATRHADTDQFEAYSAGGVDYIFTPVNATLLRTKVGLFIEQCRLRRDERRHLAQLQTANEKLTVAISERCRVEAELVASQRLLEKQNEAIAAASRHKSEFLSNMAHELRTPLNAIIGYSGTLLTRLPGPLSDDQAKQVGIVQGSARHLLSLVNDLLNLAQIESGRMEIRPEPIDCGEMLRDLTATLAPLAAAKNLVLGTDAPTGLLVSTDRRALSQILINLTNNAIKFTDAGGVQIRVCQDRRDGQDLTEFSVIDSGRGISAEGQTKLFQAFERLEDAVVHRQEGTGLGLHICHRLAAFIGAELSLESEIAKGSIFRVRLQGPSRFAEARTTDEGGDDDTGIRRQPGAKGYSHPCNVSLP